MKYDVTNVCLPPPAPSGDEDTTGINWMVLKGGTSQRCECGHWFQLSQANPTGIQH